MEDSRNLVDKYKGLTNEQVFVELEKTRSPLEIAIENVEHDFNIGSIVRTANSVNVGVAAGIAMYEYAKQHII